MIANVQLTVPILDSTCSFPKEWFHLLWLCLCTSNITVKIIPRSYSLRPISQVILGSVKLTINANNNNNSCCYQWQTFLPKTHQFSIMHMYAIFLNVLGTYGYSSFSHLSYCDNVSLNMKLHISRLHNILINSLQLYLKLRLLHHRIVLFFYYLRTSIFFHTCFLYTVFMQVFFIYIF